MDQRKKINIRYDSTANDINPLSTLLRKRLIRNYQVFRNNLRIVEPSTIKELQRVAQPRNLIIHASTYLESN